MMSCNEIYVFYIHVTQHMAIECISSGANVGKGMGLSPWAMAAGVQWRWASVAQELGQRGDIEGVGVSLVGFDHAASVRAQAGRGGRCVRRAAGASGGRFHPHFPSPCPFKCAGALICLV